MLKEIIEGLEREEIIADNIPAGVRLVAIELSDGSKVYDVQVGNKVFSAPTKELAYEKYEALEKLMADFEDMDIVGGRS